MNALLNPSTRHIAAQVDVVLSHDPAARVIAIRAQGGAQLPAQLCVGERQFSLVWCASPIAIREQLVKLSEQCAEASAAGLAAGLVLLTPLSDHALGADVLGRLARGRVFSVDAWDMVRHAFQAREIDSRLARWPWVGEALLEALPASGYPPARGGLLDVDTAWFHVLRSVLGLSVEQGGRPDLPAILRWSLAAEANQRYDALSESARRQLGEWFAELLGSCGQLLSQILNAGYGGELMPIALVCGMVLQPPQRSSDAQSRHLLAAAVRLERFTGGQPLAVRDGLRLHAAAVHVAKAMDLAGLMPVLEVADRLLESLHLNDFAHLSDDLPAGFNARLTRLASAIDAFLADGLAGHPGQRAPALAEVLAAAGRVSAHRLAPRDRQRVRRVDMAQRLARWLEQSDDRARSGLADQVHLYADDGAFVDWARLALLGGDELSSVSRSYAALREEVRRRREQQNEKFAQALCTWNSSGCSELAGVLPVERIVASLLAPTAALAPVLLLLVDGLSYPIFRQLLEDAQRQGWNEVLPATAERASIGLATIPSVTEISRCSLFCGALGQGQAANEKAGFAKHPALASLAPANRGSSRALLFHKGDLRSDVDGSSLADGVRDAVGSRERKVVGVVFNGVDDHLSGSDQLNQGWTLDDLRLIKPLLYEARNAGRLVLITADHGHLIDEATHAVAIGVGEKKTPGSAMTAMGDRWRAVGGDLAAGEILLSGGRVKTPTGQSQVVVPWSESVRFAARRNGYHGGISLQEMVVPLALLASGTSAPEGFRHAPCKLPQWWDLSTGGSRLDGAVAVGGNNMFAAAAPARKAKASAIPDHRQPTLFALPPPDPGFSGLPATGDWIGALLSSSVYKAQKQWAARAAIKDEEIRALLEALAERGGKISKTALAGRLALPLMRVAGFVNAARRLLNVDQSPILLLDEAEGSVSLNQALLEVQFQLPKVARK